MYYMGIDLGGTNIAVGITNDKWEIIYKSSVKTNTEEPEKMVKDMTDLALSVSKNANIPLSEIKSVGIGIPGALNSKEGVVVYANNLNLRDFHIVEEFHKYIDKPVYISNDANVAALGEAVAGGAKDCESAVVVTLGTGVGGGIILNGKIWEGYKSTGAEIGHTVINVDGEQCTCGRKGCWEAYSSATALIRDTKRAIEKNPDSVMTKMAEKDGKVSGKTAFAAAREGDKAAQAVVDNYIKYLAEGLANITNLIAPEVILLGGGVSHEGDNLLVPLIAETKKRMYGGGRVKHSEIRLASLGNDAGIIGAAALGR